MNLAETITDTRKRLPLLSDRLPLNHAGISPQPLGEAISHFERIRAEKTPSEALASIRLARGRVKEFYAAMLGAEANEFALTKHTAEGVNIVAQGFPWKDGDKILTVNVEYPSNVYPWWNLKDRGVEMKTVSEKNGRVDIDEFIAAIDERVRMVAISHVEFASGFAFDLDRLGKACRDRGVFLFADIAQSIGSIPVNLANVDAAAWPTWKWLMGPIGMGGFFLSKRHHDLVRPVYVGSDGMVPMADYLDYNFAFRDGAARYEYSTENILGILGSQEALERTAPFFKGGEASPVTNRIFELGAEVIRIAEGHGLRLYSSRTKSERSGILSFETPGSPSNLAAALTKENVEVAARGGRLRIAAHYYNDDSDLARLDAALKKTLNA